MKICLIDQRYRSPRTTGPSRHISYLSQSLAEAGQDVLILCEEAQGGGQYDRTSYEGIKVIELKSMGFGFLRVLKGMASTIRDEDPDVVHAQGYRNPVTDIAAAASLLNGIPFVLTPRGSLRGSRYRNVDSSIPALAEMYDLVSQKTVLRVAGAVIASSVSEASDASSLGVSPRKIRLIPHGMKFPTEHFERASLQGKPALLTVSRITPHRNITALMKSMRRIVRTYPKAILYVAGDPISYSQDKAERAYFKEVSSLELDPQLKNHVILLGGVYGRDLWQLYSSADIFLYASSYDNFGFGLLEASFFGLPVVSTDVGIAGDLIDHGKGGILIPDHNPETIADAAILLLQNEAGRTEMATHLKARAIKYSIEPNRDAHLELYRELVNRRRANTWASENIHP